MKYLLFSTLLTAALVLPTVSEASEISSPDKRILLRTHAESGQVSYTVEFNGEPIVAKSRLGVELAGGALDGPLRIHQTASDDLG